MESRTGVREDSYQFLAALTSGNMRWIERCRDHVSAMRNMVLSRNETTCLTSGRALTLVA